ncbi:hypothetical protein C8R43DRAFT_1138809 [Mycena crocata]|nr:hypothetical protein C8R43DRAFT_1138809 [Mycena crocata]
MSQSFPRLVPPFVYTAVPVHIMGAAEDVVDSVLYRLSRLLDSTRLHDYGNPTCKPVEGETKDTGRFMRWFERRLLSAATQDEEVARRAERAEADERFEYKDGTRRRNVESAHSPQDRASTQQRLRFKFVLPEDLDSDAQAGQLG